MRVPRREAEMAAAVGFVAAIPATSLPLSSSRPLPSSSVACLCVSSSLSSPYLRCPPLGSKDGNYQRDYHLRTDGGKSRRVSGTERLLGFASPSAKYIREDYLVKKVSAKELGELVKGERNVPLVVDFYATWCGPCIIMAQQLETILFKAIPVDSRISDVGIAFPSKCSCCLQNPRREDLNHLLLESELAVQIWAGFQDFLEPDLTLSNTITERLWTAAKELSISNPYGFAALYLMMMIAWEIWKGRCKKRYEDQKVHISGIISSIKWMVSKALSSLKFKDNPTAAQHDRLCRFNWKYSARVRTPIILKWSPPIFGFALNTDGSCKGDNGAAGVGGCIRDKYGRIILAYAFYYGTANNMVAKARAVLDGIRLALHYGLHLSVIHIDSKASVDLANRDNCIIPWRLLPWWNKLREALNNINCPLLCVFREANQVADKLAKEASSNRRNAEFSCWQEMPILAKRMCGP